MDERVSFPRRLRWTDTGRTPKGPSTFDHLQFCSLSLKTALDIAYSLAPVAVCFSAQPATLPNNTVGVIRQDINVSSALSSLRHTCNALAAVDAGQTQRHAIRLSLTNQPPASVSQKRTATPFFHPEKALGGAFYRSFPVP